MKTKLPYGLIEQDFCSNSEKCQILDNYMIISNNVKIILENVFKPTRNGELKLRKKFCSKRKLRNVVNKINKIKQ